MEDKNVLNNENLDQVSGGGVDSEITYIHSNCGGHIIVEDYGIRYYDFWMKCPKCGKEWHPRSINNIGMDDDIYTAVTGTF